MPDLINLIEPAAIVRHFDEHPPEGFRSMAGQLGVPSFETSFDLLTTLEPAVRRRIDALPLARAWQRLLRPRTCFVGTTVSEYALFPGDRTPEALVRDVLAANPYAFTIVKDVPTEATLVGEASFHYSRRLLQACRASGFVLVDGQALAHVPIDFRSTGEYLDRMSHTRRRNIRRKLRSRASLAVETISTGDARFDDEVFLQSMYELYRRVYDQSEIHFDLLTPEFFRALLRDTAAKGIVFVYRSVGEMIGWNLCVSANGMLIDKYVGFTYPAAREHDLYTVSWFENLEYALACGFRHYVAGWTDPEVKRHLGARFTFTVHAVRVRNPILRTLLRPLKRFFEADRRWHDAHGPTARS